MKSEEPADEMLILGCTENSCSEISPSLVNRSNLGQNPHKI